VTGGGSCDGNQPEQGEKRPAPIEDYKDTTPESSQRKSSFLKQRPLQAGLLTDRYKEGTCQPKRFIHQQDPPLIQNWPRKRSGEGKKLAPIQKTGISTPMGTAYKHLRLKPGMPWEEIKIALQVGRNQGGISSIITEIE